MTVRFPQSLKALFVLLLKCLDLDVHTSRKIELHQSVDRLLRRLENIDQALVRADLKSFTRLLIDVRRTQHAILILHCRQRNRTRNLCTRTLRSVYNLTGRSVEHTVVISLEPYANSLSNHRHQSSCGGGSQSATPRPSSFCYCRISVIVPAPTVRPPSRMAKRRPFSIATGVCSSISRAMLSPGITISVPSGSFAVPVTSVVRK